MMTGIIVTVVVVAVIASYVAVFILGRKSGAVAERLLHEQAMLQKIQAEGAWRTEKERIKEEVFGSAAERKADLNRGGTGRDSFERINDILRGDGGKDAH
jgi:hypothetical protein